MTVTRVTLSDRARRSSGDWPPIDTGSLSPYAGPVHRKIYSLDPRDRVEGFYTNVMAADRPGRLVGSACRWVPELSTDTDPSGVDLCTSSRGNSSSCSPGAVTDARAAPRRQDRAGRPSLVSADQESDCEINLAERARTFQVKSPAAVAVPLPLHRVPLFDDRSALLDAWPSRPAERFSGGSRGAGSFVARPRPNRLGSPPRSSHASPDIAGGRRCRARTGLRVRRTPPPDPRATDR